MPITPSSFRRFRKPVTFTFAGEEAHVEYYPAVFEAGALDQWNALAEQVNAAHDEEAGKAAALGFGELLCGDNGFMASWDYCENPTEPDGPPGPPVPLTPERLMEEFGKYPLFFPEYLLTIIKAIAGDVGMGKGNGTASPEPFGATSPKADSSTSSPVASSRKKSPSSLRRAGSVAAGPR